MAGLAGSDRQAGGQVGLAGAGRAEQQHVVLGGDKVQGAQVGDEVALEAAGVVEVELLQALAGREPGRLDPAFTAVAVAGGDLSSWVHDSARARSASRPAASRSVGAFNARVR